jgi:hypothetical protein
VRTCVSNRDADPPIQKLLHTAGVLCIDYYEACQRKKIVRIVGTDCHSRVEVSRQQAQKKIYWDFAHALLELAVWLQARPGRTALLRRAAKRIKKAAAAVVPCPLGMGMDLQPTGPLWCLQGAAQSKPAAAACCCRTCITHGRRGVNREPRGALVFGVDVADLLLPVFCLLLSFVL